MSDNNYLVKIAAIICMASLFFACAKDEINDLSSSIIQHELTVEEIEKTEQLIEKVVSISSSTKDFIARVRELDEVEEVAVNNDLVFITTVAGECISVDLNGKAGQQPITSEDRVDTCGIFNMSLVNRQTYEITDSIAEKTEYDPIGPDSIEMVIDNDEDEPIILRSVRLPHRTILSKKRMAIWSPWEEFKRYEEPLFSSAIKESRLECSIITNYGPSSFSSFGNYDLVYVSSHGCSDGAISIPQKYWHLYVEPFVTIKEDGKKYIDVTLARQAGIRTHFEKNDNGNVLKSVALERVFFEKHLSNLSNTIIWTSACYLGRNNSAFLLGAVTKGCPEYYGADNPCNSAGPMSAFRQFIPLFAKGASTKVAFDHVENGLRHYKKGDISYEFERYGNRNITYINPAITGAKEVKGRYAILGSLFYFSLDIAGSTNSETANQFGIFVENLQNGDKQHLPISSSNIVSSRCESWNDLFCLYLTDVKIDNLSPNTTYRYRTYVIVNNKIFYSEAVQTFKTKDFELCPNNNHPHAIDLGFGVKYSCCNVGASSPEKYGEYFEWKESQLATANWGRAWKVPSLSQLNLLITSCSYKWVALNGVNGMLFIGKNGNGIFLPAAGIRLYDGLHGIGIEGNYWSSDPAPGGGDNGGCALYFNSAYPTTGYGFCNGYTIRPIAKL